MTGFSLCMMLAAKDPAYILAKVRTQKKRHPKMAFLFQRRIALLLCEKSADFFGVQGAVFVCI